MHGMVNVMAVHARLLGRWVQGEVARTGASAGPRPNALVGDIGVAGQQSPTVHDFTAHLRGHAGRSVGNTLAFGVWFEFLHRTFCKWKRSPARVGRTAWKAMAAMHDLIPQVDGQDPVCVSRARPRRPT